MVEKAVNPTRDSRAITKPFRSAAANSKRNRRRIQWPCSALKQNAMIALSFGMRGSNGIV